MFKKPALIIIFILGILACIYAEDTNAGAAANGDEETITTLTDNFSTLVYPSFWHTPFGIHRGTPLHLKLFLGNRTYFDNPQGLACTKLLLDYGKINKDKDDWQLTVYGVNSGRGEIIYNPSMHSLAVFGEKGSREGQLFNPKGIACNEYGDIYIADTGNDRIARFYNNGRKVTFIRNIGDTGSGPGKFNKPSYVALDSNGRIYVSDSGNNRVQLFSKSGGYLASIGQEKGILNPQGICVCDDAERYSGYRVNCIYLIDGNNSRVQKFDFNGNLMQSIRVNDILGKSVFLTSLAQDYYGNVYIVDNLNSCVYKFSPDLRFIAEAGKYGSGDYEFENPTGIAIYKHYGQVFVSDKESAQYFWIGSDARDFTVKQIKTGESDKLQFDFFLTEKSYVCIQIVPEDTSIKPVEVCAKAGLEMGKNSIEWDIPTVFKGVIRPGFTYGVNLRVMSTYSSYPHIEKVLKSSVYIE